jgi:hypothetical protein
VGVSAHHPPPPTPHHSFKKGLLAASLSRITLDKPENGSYWYEGAMCVII